MAFASGNGGLITWTRAAEDPSDPLWVTANVTGWTLTEKRVEFKDVTPHPSALDVDYQHLVYQVPGRILFEGSIQMLLFVLQFPYGDLNLKPATVKLEQAFGGTDTQFVAGEVWLSEITQTGHVRDAVRLEAKIRSFIGRLVKVPSNP